MPDKSKKTVGKVIEPPKMVVPKKTRLLKPTRSISPYFVGGLAWPNIPRSHDVQAMALQVEFAMIERWPPEKILEYQLAQAQALINHAYRTVPYYKDILAPLAGRKPGNLTMAEFRKIPILTRGMIQENRETLVTTDLPKNHGSMFDVRTSGSTGKPLVVKGTGITGTMYSAQNSRGHIWHKRDLSLKNVSLRAVDKNKPISRGIGWAPGSLGEAIVMTKSIPTSELLDILIVEDPYYIQCFPTTLHELLRVSKTRNIVPNNLRQVRTMAETLEPALKKQASKQWGIEVVDNYSTMELNIIAHQCPDNPDLKHIMSESVLIEVIDDDGLICPPGVAGRGVATALVNYGSPLIRYEYGDTLIAGELCSCGRGLPTLERVIGRMHNLMVLPNGDKFSPTLPISDDMFDIPVIQHQLVQVSMEVIEIRLVVSRPLTPEEEAFVIDVFAGENYPFKYVLSYVDEIPKMPSGKYDYFRCEVES